MELTVDDILNIKTIRFGSKKQHSVVWHSTKQRIDYVDSILFSIQAKEDASATANLSLDGIRVVSLSNGTMVFTNPKEQFMEQVTVPRHIGEFVCKEFGIVPEVVEPDREIYLDI
ncbi:hypothetical protein [Vibrio sp. Hal054]|uniref:hypothetical protein n=1 Tax=Vibrio sp. Hal054 TaxID=3035158 RepID=UPI00301D8436